MRPATPTSKQYVFRITGHKKHEFSSEKHILFAAQISIPLCFTSSWSNLLFALCSGKSRLCWTQVSDEADFWQSVGFFKYIIYPNMSTRLLVIAQCWKKFQICSSINSHNSRRDDKELRKKRNSERKKKHLSSSLGNTWHRFCFFFCLLS